MPDPTGELFVYNPGASGVVNHFITTYDDGGHTIDHWRVDASYGPLPSAAGDTNLGDNQVKLAQPAGSYVATLVLIEAHVHEWYVYDVHYDFDGAETVTGTDEGARTGGADLPGAGDCGAITIQSPLDIDPLVLAADETNGTDADGIVWFWTDLDGWYGPPPMRISELDVEQSADVQGTRATSVTRGARIVTIEGFARTATPDLYYLALAKLEAVCDSFYLGSSPESVSGSLVFAGLAGAPTSETLDGVLLNDRPTSEPWGELDGLTFTLEFRAPDPVKT